MSQPKIITNKLATHAEIYLLGEIDKYEDGVSSAEFIAALNDLKREYENIELMINCAGGDVYEGFAIYNAIKATRQIQWSNIIGVAASFGGLLAMSTPKCKMAKRARLMTHACSGFAYGNSTELRNRLEELERCDIDQANMIAAKVGITEQEAKERFVGAVDKYFSSDQAMREGLVDEVYDADAVEIPNGVKTAKEMQPYYTAAIMAQMDYKQDNQTVNIIL